MVSNFYDDLNKGRIAEEIVLNTFKGLTDKYTFTSVGDDVECFRKGDIKCETQDGKVIYLEVKNDSRIGDTKNILCEEEVFYKDNGNIVKGFMFSDYEIYCVVSEPEERIYVIDFKVLKEIYRKGEFKRIHHFAQFSDCYLVPLWLIKKYGGLITIVNY